MIDDACQKAPARSLSAIGRTHGNGQELGLVGRDAAKGKAGIAAVKLQQQTMGAGRRQQRADVLSRPGALPERHKGLGMQAGRSIEIERTERRDREMHGHSLDRPACSSRLPA